MSAKKWVRRAIEERLWTWIEIWDKRGTYTRGGLYHTRKDAQQAYRNQCVGDNPVQFVRVTLTYEMNNAE